VHVALAVDGQPAVAAVAQPAAGTLYRATAGQGAFRMAGEGGIPGRLAVSTVGELRAFRVGISRHNAPAALLRCLDAAGLGERAVRMGASAKYLALARGELEALITLTTGEKEWDTCAPELVVREAGGTVTDLDGRPLPYNQRDIGRPRGIVASNGVCHAELLALCRPYAG
jgi:3'-phosphoadenosine 5'-phosphosulfate (PAPS) 3'-phosphatase